MKLEAVATMIYEQAGICSKTKREVSKSRTENEGRILKNKRELLGV